VLSRRFIRLLSVMAVSLLVLMPVPGQDLKADPAAKLLPDKIGDFRASGRFESQRNPLPDRAGESFGVELVEGKTYVSKDGGLYSVSLSKAISDSAAYAHLTQARNSFEEAHVGVTDADAGTAGFLVLNGDANNLMFFKGRAIVVVREEKQVRDSQALQNFARALADTLDKGAGEIPVLAKHLPAWENAETRVLYAIDADALKKQFSNQTIFDTVSFAGGAECVVGHYGAQQLTIIEFNTASLATDNDQRVKAKLQELIAQGQPTPTAYRRVGNYGVFVFDAPSAEAANQLIDQVKYQQVVQWLGENPFSYERATREFTETTLGVLVSVVKTSGLALVACLAVGGFFGALLFRSRRAQQRSREAYVDADAMLRLNLDELTPESEPGRLLGPKANH
jgi:hypothetical protein